jgi:autotransporter translocation and assembly factor TamB
MPTQARWRGWRWLKRGTLGIVALVALAVIAALVAVHTDRGRDLVRAQVEARLQTTFTGGASLGRLEGSPFGDLTLHDLVINGPDGRPAISIKSLTLRVGILALLSHQARVVAVLADGVDVDLRRDPRGELQIKRLLRPGPASTWSVALPRIELRHTHVRFDTGREVLNFDALALDARARLPHGGPIDASLELRGTWRERGAAPLDLRTAVHRDDAGIAMPYLVLRAGDVSVLGNHVTVAPSPGDAAPAIGGALTVQASAAAVARLAPEVQLPADLALTITAQPSRTRPWTELAVAGRIDDTWVRFLGTADLAGKHARGQLSTGTLDLTKLSCGAVVGSAAADVVFDVRPGGARALPVASATIHGWGELDGVPHTTFDIALSAAGERARATIDLAGQGVTARLAASVRAVGETLAIEAATLHAATSDPARASGGKAPVHGALRVDLAASGAVRPTPSIALTGTIDGRNLRMKDLSIASLHVAVDAARLPNRPLGNAHVQISDLVRGDVQLRTLTVDAADRSDGKVAVQVRTQPRQNPWLIDADALVTPPAAAGPGTFAIDLIRHHVRAGSGAEWTGRTGHLEIGPERIELRDLVSASLVGRLAIAASYERAGRRQGDLRARVDATSLALDNLAGAYHGKLDAHADVSRRAGRWDGELRVDGAGLSKDPQTAMFDAHARAALHGPTLQVTADATSLGVGKVGLAIDLDAPALVTSAAAWKRLGRSAIRTGQLTLQGIDVRRAAELAELPGAYAGRIDGDIRISATTTGGRIELRDLTAPALRGMTGVGAVLDLSQTAPTVLTPTLSVAAEGLGRATVQAELEMPDRVFDPAAWAQLGRGALHGATLRAEDLTIDPATLDRLGVVSELRGKLSLAVDVGEAARTLEAKVDVAGLRGAPIDQPLELHLAAAADDRKITSTLAVLTHGAPLLEVEGRVPVSLAALLDRRTRSPEALRATPITAVARLAKVDAVRLLGVFGRTEVTAGTVDGAVEIAGTLGAPTAKVKLVASGLQVPPGPRGKPVRTVDQLTIDGTWNGDLARLEVVGTESEGGRLRVAGSVRPAAPRDGTLTIQASKFDLVPILAFLPGPAGGAAGQLDANLTFQGLDLRTTRVAGELHLLDARVPIAPSVGTLRRAKIDAMIVDHEMKLIVDGKLGAGDVAVTGSVALDGAAPNGGKARITLRKVSPIGTVEPQITADISATLSRDRNQWHADLLVDHGLVIVPSGRGEKLKPVGAPPDMVFANGERITQRPMKHDAPTNPIFVVSVALRSTRVESDEFRGLIKGRIELRADGESVGVVGGIEADRGDLDLFGHRYYVERAGVHFDGSLDPLLDVRITHNFSDVTTATEIRGRASKPELTLSSDPGTYSQGELLGFLLGGEPSGDPQNGSAQDKVAGAGASFVANKLGSYVRGALPVDIDVLRYEAATSASSAAVTVGTWITHSLFVAYRQHLESRADENTGEGQLEYWLSRRIVVEGTAGNRGYDGVDLLWRFRY